MNEEEWERFVEEHPDSTFFHSIGWKKVIEKVFGFSPVYMIARDQRQIQGILPLFEIHQKTGKKLLSLPFSTEGGILYNTEEAKDMLIKKAKDLVDEKGFDYLELRQEKDIGTDLENKDYYCHMKLKLDPDPEKIWKSMDKKARNAIRKAKKLGLTTDKGIHYLDDFYRIFSRNMRDLGTPVDKKEFFEEIIRQFPEKTDIIVAKFKEKVIGAIFILKHKKTIKTEWASSYRRYFGYNASQIMFWRAIEDACKKGFKTFDFGRSILDEGTYNFKKKFNAEPYPLHYKYYTPEGKIPDIRKTNWKRISFANAWKHTPLFIANKIGPKLREQFP